MITATRDKQLSTKKKKFIPPTKPVIIAFLSQKGGVGKTTTATHARDWFEQFGSVGFIDADAQRSSSKWLSAISPEIEYTVMGEARTLLRELPNVKEQFDYVIVDAPGSMEDVSRAILSRCDIVVIPCQTSQLDLDSNDETIEMVEVAQDIRGAYLKPFYSLIVLRKAPSYYGKLLKRQTKMKIPGSMCSLLIQSSIKEHA